MEAMSDGAISIIKDHGFIPEVVAIVGTIVAHREEVEPTVSEMIEFVNDPAKREALAQILSRRDMEHYSEMKVGFTLQSMLGRVVQ